MQQKKKNAWEKKPPMLSLIRIETKSYIIKKKKRKSTPSLFYFKGLTAILKASNKLTPYFHWGLTISYPKI